ncbi:pyrimidine utilization protein D [Shigella flexneri]
MVTATGGAGAGCQVVCYDQRGTGNNPDTLAEDYSIAQMAAELHQVLVAAGIEHYAVVGHALGALVGMQLALDYPASVTVLVSVNGWLRINAHTRRCFQVRERLLYSGGAQAWVEAQPLLLYPPTGWRPAHLALRQKTRWHWRIFRAKIIYCVDLTPSNALTSSPCGSHPLPVQIICASDNLLVPTACSSELHAALPDSQKMVMPYGGHACNVTDPETFNALLLNGLASLLHHREAAL